MQDPHPYVQDTTAWTIGRIFEFMHSPDIEPPIVTPDTLPPIIACLTKSLMGSPHIAYRVCCAISSLAAGFQGSTGAGGCGWRGQGEGQQVVRSGAARTQEVSHGSGGVFYGNVGWVCSEVGETGNKSKGDCEHPGLHSREYS